MKRYRQTLTLLFLFFMVSCGRVEPEETLVVQAATETRSAASTDTLTPTPTPTEPIFEPYVTSCVELLDHVPEDVDLSGVLVFHDILLNLETGEEIPLEKDWFDGKTHISPDRDKIAFSFQQNQIQIFNAVGIEIKNIYIPGDDWLKPAYWINPSSLVLYKDFPLEGSGFGVFSDYSAILNIDTGDLIEIPAETFSDFHPYEIGKAWNVTRSVISPDGRYIIYATTIDLISDWMVLWDLENDTEVARFEGFRYSTAPLWSPDGGSFITTLNWEPFSADDDLPYVGGNELVRIPIGGAIERLTYLTAVFNAGEYSFDWSPNGDKIAFWLATDLDLEEYQLAVLDVNNGKVTNYCVRGVYTPVWSPDGKYLAIAIGIQEPDIFNNVVVVDIEKNLMYLIKEYTENEGWMN